MKAISLWQPWASFIANGLKPFETRPWAPPKWLVGKRIAIHAAKRPTSKDDREWAAGLGISDLPFGAIVCTVELRGVFKCHEDSLLPQLYPPDEFGDYSPGRWAWHLVDIERFEPPIPALGARGFWDWAGGGDG